MKINKLAYVAIGAIFALIVSFSWITWADTAKEDKSMGATETASAVESSTSIEGQVSFLDRATGQIAVFDGKQKHEFQSNPWTQVVIDEKKADISQLNLGDEVQVFCNSEGQLRYIIVHKGNQPSVKAEQTQGKTAEVRKMNESEPLDELKISLQQDHINIKLEWKPDKAQVEVKKPDGSFELKGEEAVEYIQQWYSRLNLAEEKNSDEVLYNIAGSFFLDVKKPFSAEIEWKKNGKSGKRKVDPQDRGKHKGKGEKKHEDDKKEDHDEDD